MKRCVLGLESKLAWQVVRWKAEESYVLHVDEVISSPRLRLFCCVELLTIDVILIYALY